MTLTFTPTRPVPALPGASLLGLNASTLLELGAAVDQGFSPDALERFARRLGFTLAETLSLIQLSESTYHSYRRKGRALSADSSAHLYHLARVTEVAEHYFGSVTDAHHWLVTSRMTFGNKTPLQFALLPGGAEYVNTVLSRLEHGVYT
ncbi:type II RES/Xre toxin-antitoxin system antitoxin [Deinococcus saxicola]|uniref:type II RES/Xre toxin-antitoxin system antitoxin n=1 Tax=Deinococcus saxicola TaxID=249406 RepID=UPI0039EE7F82